MAEINTGQDRLSGVFPIRENQVVDAQLRPLKAGTHKELALHMAEEAAEQMGAVSGVKGLGDPASFWSAFNVSLESGAISSGQNFNGKYPGAFGGLGQVAQDPRQRGFGP